MLLLLLLLWLFDAVMLVLVLMLWLGVCAEAALRGRTGDADFYKKITIMCCTSFISPHAHTITSAYQRTNPNCSLPLRRPQENALVQL